ncbi:DUF4145 domain-containing protein [Burkholderia sp. Tr-862]|nr:DUF4145 domain-containing protein [Burkholderia sp. Tr-862]
MSEGDLRADGAIKVCLYFVRFAAPTELIALAFGQPLGAFQILFLLTNQLHRAHYFLTRYSRENYKMAPLINTDLDLADDFSCSVGFAYREGVEFSRVLPSHSLVRFRDVLDEICVGLARLAGFDDLNDGKTSLFEKINFLGDQRVIPREVKNAFHEARKLCNSGAHQSPKQGDPDSGANTESPVRDALIRNAEAVRSLVVSCLLHSFQKKITPSMRRTSRWLPSKPKSSNKSSSPPRQLPTRTSNTRPAFGAKERRSDGNSNSRD